MSGDATSDADGRAQENWRRTAPLGILARSLSSLRQSILPMVAIAIGGGGFGEDLPIAPLAILAMLVGIPLVAWIGWRHHRYTVGSDDIRVEKGLLSRQVRAVPFDRIQDVSLQEPPVARLFGLVEVKFDTGAGGKDEVALAYVTREEAAALRDTVRARRDGQVAGANPAAPQEAEEGQILYAIGPRRLLLFGLFEFSLVVFAVLFGAVEQFDSVLPFDIWDAGTWRDLLSEPGHWLLGLGVAAQAIGALLALASLALVGLATGVVRTALREYGFRLERTSQGLRRRRGLLTRTDMVMPLHRVQALQVTTGIVRRRFGWHGLSAVSLAADEKSTSHAIAPFAPMEEIARIVPVTGFSLPSPDTAWRSTAAAWHRNAALLVAVPLVALALAALLGAPVAAVGIVQPALVALPLLLAAGLVALRRWYLWRFDRFALDARQVLARRGWLSPHLDIASRVRVQSVELVQGPLARRGGYAALHLGIAGGRLDIEGVPLADAMALRDAILESIAATDFSRLGR